MMGGGFGYSNKRKMKETKSSPSMGKIMNINSLKCHSDRVSVIGVARTKSNFGWEFFSFPFSKVIES